MVRLKLALACLLCAGAVGAQELPFAPEYPATFETGASAAIKAGARTTTTSGGAARAGRATSTPPPEIAALIARHASANGVPQELAHRLILRESRYDPSARNRAYWGLMQISHATARGLGYRGPAHGLLDPETNLRYGMAYLGNAYRVAAGDQRRAMRLYASGFYREAKRKRMLGQMRSPAEIAAVATR